MKTLNPYLNLAGKCREAMTFYKECLNGEITMMQTYEEIGMSEPAQFKDNIIHSELRAEGLVLQASDGRHDQPPTVGDNVTLALLMNDEVEQARIFEALSQGGTVIQPLQATYWGAIFGILTDRYGINWMFNCDKQPAANG